MLDLQFPVKLFDKESIDYFAEIDRVEEGASTEEDGDHRDEDHQSVHNSRPSVTQHTRVCMGDV